MSFKGYSQFGSELVSFNYVLAPIGNDDIDFYKTELKLNIPIKLKKGILVNSVSFNDYQLGYSNVDFNTESLDDFFGINYRLQYIYPLNKKWKLGARVGVSITSNLTASLTTEDLLFNGGIMAIKRGGTYEKPSLLTFGLGNTTITGKQKVLPMISYVKKMNEKFSFGIGFPMAFAKYELNEKNSLKASVWVNGFYANLSNPVVVNLTDSAYKASFTATSLGLEYNYWMDEIWAVSFKAGYSLYSKYELLDDVNDTVYKFDLGPKPYFSMGLKLNLKNKFKNKFNNRNRNEK